ncbi:MAG: Holliday junction resolvase RuvX, partial [Sphingobacteriaceae bacterium]|nr:Holliday junction resolvase RuvX [Sphingobacteriaceae bacterium]
LLIVGCPHVHDNPQKIQMVNTINNFAKRLERKFNLSVIMINEDFSSDHASSLLNEQGVYGREQKGKLDQLAACSILQTYFSNQSKSELVADD